MNALKEMRQLYRDIKHTCRGLKHPISVRHKMAEAKEHLKSSPDLTDAEKELVEKVSSIIDRKDTMYAGDAVHYLSAGLSGLRCVEQALKAAGKEIWKGAILDFPCGYGRVLRFMRVRFPDARITAAEIDRDAFQFCATTFHVTPLESKIPISALELDAKYDLIWCGSLFTHIDESAAVELLRFFHDHLAIGGVCVFSTHGRRAVERMVTNEVDYGLDHEEQSRLIRDYHSPGYGYADYQGQPGYGISAVTPERVDELAARVGSWERVCFLDHGWDGCQDVFGFAKR